MLKADRHLVKGRNKKNIKIDKGIGLKIRINEIILIALIDLISTAFLYSKAIKKRRPKININQKGIKVDHGIEVEIKKG